MTHQKGRGFWLGQVAAFEGSGLRQREFCKRRGLCLGTFQHWLYRLRNEVRGASQSGSLVRVEPVNPVPMEIPLEAGLPSGVVLRFVVGTDPRYVASVVAEVENARC